MRHPLSTQRDAENYVAALGQVAPGWRKHLRKRGARSAADTIPPRFIIEATLTQMKQFIANAAGQNPFVTTFEQTDERGRRQFPIAGGWNSERKPRRIVSEQIVSGMATARSHSSNRWRAKATHDAGLWRFKGGPEAYAYFLRRFTTTDLTPDQIHDIGLREVARIEKEMDAILRQLGRTNGSVKDRIDKLKSRSRLPENGRRTQVDHGGRRADPPGRGKTVAVNV